MDILLYEYPPTRSARCRWTLLEAGLDYESVNRRELIHSEELRKVHPLGKLPAAVIDGQPLFESAAISTYIADRAPEAGLISPSGTAERARHDQWVCFCLSELEAPLWSSAKNTFVYPEEKRLPAVFDQNNEDFKTAAAVIDRALGDADYLVGNRFTVADIIVGYTVNWGRRQGVLDDLARLFERPHCTLNPE